MTADNAIFLDTNIFMYTAGKDPDWRAICDLAVQESLVRNLMLVTNAEVLQEILHRYFSQRRPGDAQLVHDAAVSQRWRRAVSARCFRWTPTSTRCPVWIA